MLRTEVMSLLLLRTQYLDLRSAYSQYSVCFMWENEFRKQKSLYPPPTLSHSPIPPLVSISSSWLWGNVTPPFHTVSITLFHILGSSQSRLLIIHLPPPICLPSCKPFLILVFLCSALSSLPSTLPGNIMPSFPLFRVQPRGFLYEIFSDLLLTNHPSLSSLNNYRTLQLESTKYEPFVLLLLPFPKK